MVFRFDRFLALHRCLSFLSDPLFMNGRFSSIEETTACSLFLLQGCGLEGAAELLSNLPDNAEEKDFQKVWFELV